MAVIKTSAPSAETSWKNKIRFAGIKTNAVKIFNIFRAPIMISEETGAGYSRGKRQYVAVR